MNFGRNAVNCLKVSFISCRSYRINTSGSFWSSYYRPWDKLFPIFKPVSIDTISSIAGLTALASLNVSNSRITNAGLQHLKPLKNLRSLTLESCKVTATEIKKLQLAALPNLISVRPE
ncbi:hypothetical protein B296_00021123 [Ensete ventricosum]|uniref:Uncharacterized protein n=1 Tax=Ensete ventricosum TaxID=4639 RepID=A0A427AQA0_ENSVE|nr:hypothetical protein B296_00021123 [Ensete ventricosum]